MGRVPRIMAALTSLAMLAFALAMCYLAVSNYATSVQGGIGITRTDIITHCNAYISALLAGTMVAFLIHSKEVSDQRINNTLYTKARRVNDNGRFCLHYMHRCDTRWRFSCTAL